MLLLYQKRERLLIMSQVHQCYLSIALRKKSRQTAGKRVPDHQKLSMPIGIVQMDQGLISVQEYLIGIVLFQLIPKENTFMGHPCTYRGDWRRACP